MNIPDGYKLVPIEPTESMLKAMQEVIEKSYNGAPAPKPVKVEYFE